MQNKNKNISIVILIISVVSIPIFMLLFNHVHFPYFFFDEKFYIELAQSFHSQQTFVFEGKALVPLRILYSIIISPVFYFSNFCISYKAVQWTNHVIFSFSVIPVFLLAKFLFKNKSYALLISIAVLVMPGRLYANAALPESLYIFLFVFCFYFIWQIFCSPNLITVFLAALFFAFCFFTKQQCLLLIPIFIMTLILELFFRKDKKILFYFAVITSFLIIAGIVFLWRKNLFAHYVSLFSLNPTMLLSSYKYFLAQFLVLGWVTGLLPLLCLFLSLKNLKKFSLDKRVFILLTISTVICFWIFTSLYLSVQNAKYIHIDLFARYYIAIIPIIWIAGLIYNPFNPPLLWGHCSQKSSLFLLIAIIIFCCLSCWILPEFVTERVDENALSISGWFISEKPLYQTGILISSFMFIWAILQLFLIGKKRIYVLIAGLIILTFVASNRQKKYAETFSETGVPISKWLNKNVPKNAPLIYANGGFDKSLFLTEVLAPRRMQRYLFITDSQRFRYSLLNSTIFFGTKYVLVPIDLEIPGVQISSFNGYKLYKVKDKALELGEAGEIKVIGVNEFGVITGTNFVIAVSCSENIDELKLKIEFDTQNIKSDKIELKATQEKSEKLKNLKISSGIESCSFKLNRNSRGIFKIEISIPETAIGIILNSVKIKI